MPSQSARAIRPDHNYFTCTSVCADVLEVAEISPGFLSEEPAFTDADDRTSASAFTFDALCCASALVASTVRAVRFLAFAPVDTVLSFTSDDVFTAAPVVFR